MTAGAALSRVVLAAHGSRDPRHAPVVASIARALGEQGYDVAVGWLDLIEPSLASVVASRPGAVVVPLLVSPAFHATVDVPAAAGGCTVAQVLAPDERLLDAVDDRLAAALPPGAPPPDGLVLAAAGSSDPAAHTLVTAVAACWAARRGVPVEVAYASTQPDVATALAALRASGVRDPAVGCLLLTPGRLHDAVLAAAAPSGAPVSEWLGSHPALVAVLNDRAAAALGPAPPGIAGATAE